MRLWSLHPKYLDAKGLVALWRETLLAQKVLQGETKGYKNHPQLNRFKEHPRPKAAIASYLSEIWKEADRRGYQFDRKKIGSAKTSRKISVTTGQLEYELIWLKKKLKIRDTSHLKKIKRYKQIQAHSLLKKISGKIEPWEKI